MRGVILAAGEGTRLRPDGAPKALAEVGGEPLLARQVRWLRSWGVDEITVTMLARWADDARPFSRDLGFRLLLEDRPHGTAGSLSRAVASNTQPIVVLLADVVTDLDVGRLFTELAFAHATIAVVEDDYAGKGAVFVSKSNRVTDFIEKPRIRGRGLVCAGVYAFRPVIVRLCDGARDLGGDVFPAAIRRGVKIRAVRYPTNLAVGVDTEESLACARAAVGAGRIVW